jgi:hypothetical protein
MKFVGVISTSSSYTKNEERVPINKVEQQGNETTIGGGGGGGGLRGS